MAAATRCGESGGRRPYLAVTRVTEEMAVKYYVKFYISRRRRWLGSTAATALQSYLAHLILAVAGREPAPQLFYILDYLYGDSKVISQFARHWWFPHQNCGGDLFCN